MRSSSSGSRERSVTAAREAGVNAITSNLTGGSGMLPAKTDVWRGAAAGEPSGYIMQSHPERASSPCVSLEREHLGFFLLRQLVHPAHELVGRLLDGVVAATLLVLGHLLVLCEGLQLVVGLSPDVPDRHPRVLRELVHGLGELLAPVLGEGRQGEADHLAVVGGREAEVRLRDRLLDVVHLARVPRLDQQRLRIRHGDGGELIDRRDVAVGLDAERVEERGVGAPRAHAAELPGEQIHRRLHARLHVLEQGFVHGAHSLRGPASADTTEPTGSPITIRLMLPLRVRSNTTMGSLFSMQSEIAVVSITWSPRLSTSM